MRQFISSMQLHCHGNRFLIDSFSCVSMLEHFSQIRVNDQAVRDLPTFLTLHIPSISAVGNLTTTYTHMYIHQ